MSKLPLHEGTLSLNATATSAPADAGTLTIPGLTVAEPAIKVLDSLSIASASGKMLYTAANCLTTHHANAALTSDTVVETLGDTAVESTDATGE